MRSIVPGADANSQIDRLKALGYAIIDVESTSTPMTLAAAAPDRPLRRGVNP